MNALEEALAYRKLMDMCGITQDEVARRVGKNRTTVTNALRLLKLPENMQTSLANDEITAGHARALLSVTNPADQRILFARILGQDLSVRETERQAAELNGGGKAAVKAKPKKAEKKDPDISSLEEQFIEALGTKVQLKGSLDKGSLQIEYFSRDDLDRDFKGSGHQFSFLHQFRQNVVNVFKKAVYLAELAVFLRVNFAVFCHYAELNKKIDGSSFF